MKLTSPAFVNNGNIPSKYTCDGAGIIPPLNFSDVPSKAKSFALIVDDPDAPRGTWDHWILWNLPTNIRCVNECEAPDAVYGTNSFKRLEWGAPCPPDREHRYFFKLYALDTILTLPEGSTKAQLESAMADHIVAKAELIGRYNRKR